MAAAAAARDGAERAGRVRARHLTRAGHVSGTAAPERKARDATAATAPAYWLPGLTAARELHRPERTVASVSSHWLPFPSPPCR